jgi:hypothetical protein
MPINLTYPELKETQSQTLPPASNESLRQLREEMCSQSASRDFKLQNYQRFLRRVMSPDSPVRCLLMVHGTGTGKTCTAIQIAEEYIIRPEFQDKRVLLLANPAVQENFRTQIFDMERVSLDKDGLLLSKQCTGRRYLDMLLRIQSEPLKWTDKVARERITTISQRIINEFYEFQGYNEFANKLDRQKLLGGETFIENWIHKTFDNRMIIVDEAHNLRVSAESDTTKLVSLAIEQIIKTAHNVTLILLTATPMFDRFDEIIYYFNLFLWNDRRQKNTVTIQPSKIFTEDGDFLEGTEQLFRGWCQDYISFIRGDNPLTFPFRIPPPPELIAPPSNRDLKNNIITVGRKRKVLALTQSFVQGYQEEVVSKLQLQGGIIANETICVLPNNAPFRTVFTQSDEGYSYSTGMPAFLSPDQIANYSSKFALIIKLIKESRGVIFVYSNLVEYGARLFGMCLEEHGYESALGYRLITKINDESLRGSKGKYILFTSDTSNSDLKRSLQRLKSVSNVDGQDIKVIVASPRVSEGVDLRYIRQIHLLDYWFNMSRIEQVVGRGIRTCSHQKLPFEQQNCTVYLHICKLKDSTRELLDEHMYREYVERKATIISKVKKVIMESAMDCPLQQDINSLPEDWRNLEIEQIRSQDGRSVNLKLGEMASPMFDSSILVCNVRESIENPEHERPLSAYTDVRDELLDKFLKLFLKKPVWTKEDLFRSKTLQIYDQDVILYTLQNAIETGFQLKNQIGKVGHLESKGNMYAFTLNKYSSLQDRYLKQDRGRQVSLSKVEEDEKHENSIPLADKRKLIKFQFPDEVIDWYIVDHILTPKERVQHMLELDWSNPPVYAATLKTETLKILGSKKIYNEQNELITPIGEQADEYSQWVKEKLAAYISTRNQFFATVKDGVILFNLDEKADTLQKADRSKNIGGRACTSYPEKILNLFVEWTGTGFTSQVKTKIDRCQFLSLAIRDAIIKKKEGIVWWTPEEWSIFTEDENRKELLAKLKM